MTNYYTLIGKSVLCPQYKKNITLSAKYRYTGNSENEFEVQFCFATCPIQENSKLHKDDQHKEYKYLECFTPNCKHLTDFPLLWDSRENF